METPGLKDGQQHLRALKSMGYEPSGPFVASILELKLDQTTLFEWQKHSQSSASIPHYRELLESSLPGVGDLCQATKERLLCTEEGPISVQAYHLLRIGHV